MSGNFKALLETIPTDAICSAGSTGCIRLILKNPDLGACLIGNAGDNFGFAGDIFIGFLGEDDAAFGNSTQAGVGVLTRRGEGIRDIWKGARCGDWRGEGIRDIRKGACGGDWRLGDWRGDEIRPNGLKSNSTDDNSCGELFDELRECDDLFRGLLSLTVFFSIHSIL